MRTKHYFKGMTLVEMMTVLAVFALLLFLAAPSISGYLEDRKIRNVAESLFYGMQKARLHAVRTNTPTQFAWDGTGWTVSQLNMEDLTPITPALESFDWCAGGNNKGTSISAVAVLGGASQTSAVLTFDGTGRVVLPSNPVDGSRPPDRFEVSGRPGSRAFRVMVNGGGLRVCDPQLPQSDPKGC